MRPDLSVPIVLYVDSAGPGGTAFYALNLGCELRRLGYRVGVICSAVPDMSRMRQELLGVGAEVHALHNEDRGILGRLNRLSWFHSVLRRYQGGVLVLLLGNHVNGTA